MFCFLYYGSSSYVLLKICEKSVDELMSVAYKFVNFKCWPYIFMLFQKNYYIELSYRNWYLECKLTGVYTRFCF